MNNETLELAQLVEGWHKNATDQLELVIEKKDADMKLGDAKIKAGTDLHKGVRIGIGIALSMIKELPFTLKEN